MAAKPENSFRLGVFRYLPEGLHHEKMHNPYRGGTADDWISGSKADLWIEFKFIALPKRDATLINLDLSELQKLWLRGRVREGRNCRVICGCKEGGAIFESPPEWERSLTTAEFKERLVPRQEIAKYILDLTGGPP